MKNIDKTFSDNLKGRLRAKQDEMPKVAGTMGTADGRLHVPNLDGYIYVTIADKSVPVFCSLVAPRVGKKVWVGKTSVDSKLEQVLSTRSSTPEGGSTITGSGYAPATRYEWMRKGGSQDPLHVHLRALSYLKISPSQLGGLNIELFGGVVRSSGTSIRIEKQDIDISAHVPVTAGKSALVKISIDSVGAVVQTKGTEFDTGDPITLALEPDDPADTVFVSGMVRVYYGQTTPRETPTNTDFIDLRFTGLNWGAGGSGGISDAPSDGVRYGRKDGAWVDLDAVYGGGGIPVVTSDPATPTDGQLWSLRATTGAIADGTAMGALGMTYSGNTGSTALLQLSQWDDVAGTIIRYARS